MNIYETEFFCRCPQNGIRIKYHLTIQHPEKIMVESIIKSIESFADGFHEDIADKVHKEFGGLQTLVADHHGVRITTHRK
jgi:hypothetical protein